MELGLQLYRHGKNAYLAFTKPQFWFPAAHKLVILKHFCIPSTWETDARESEVWGYLWLQTKFWGQSGLHEILTQKKKVTNFLRVVYLR